MTRDSMWLWGGIVAAVIVGLATLDTQTALSFGIPATWLPYVRGAAFVVGIISGKLATSPLPHSNEVKS